MGQRVVVVTDSSAMLPPAVASARGIVVAPLHVVIGDEELEEGQPGTSPDQVAAALIAKASVSTSRPSPASLSALYRRLADEGADAVVAVHLSSEVSGTVESAQMAARDAPIAVLVVDSRAVGPCVGFAALAAADAIAEGASAFEAAERAETRAAATASYFYVDTLEYLRRGGRIGAAAALLGSALAVKPLLTIDGGHVVAHERVRTSGRALARLEELAMEAVDAPRVEVVVAHLRSRERADELAANLTDRFAGRLVGSVRVGEVSAALAAHVGPGMLAVCVTPSR
ncbi:EDD domain protein, DegV family [Nocardioides terrae]|uniref:EDD domain protein, DegV family n=1 Tax=Nocardioides terrae TaxID=574651 RepID=A0A1I1D7R7_9ACTN|nr:DegV family protein [Nocardioides terrae]SFB70991.1 EDD domain protein, DegV family [Nocardioides terrae]